MDISPNSTSQVPSSDTLILEGHASVVYACAWSPTGSLLASGSEDSTARIWTISDGSGGSGMRNSLVNVLVLQHPNSRVNQEPNSVLTLDWNGEGTLLATGSCDGKARIWNTNGELRSTLSLTKHRGSVKPVKWNKKGNYILTGSHDKTAIVWDVKSEECIQQFKFHTGEILDADWRDNVSFAISFTDSMIYVFEIEKSHPVSTFPGHQDHVNCVKWDPTGLLLASCSDDLSAKIWSLKHDKLVHDLRGHSSEIYTVRWSPTGPHTNNPNKLSVLASASYDSTVKLWDAESGHLFCTLIGDSEPVYTVAFSPNGEYLATGSLRGTMNVWSLKENKIVKRYAGKCNGGGVQEVCWNNEGDKVAAGLSNNTVCVLDFRL